MLRLSMPVISLLIPLLPSHGADAKEPPQVVKSLLGAWKQDKTDKTNLIRFEPERFTQFLDGKLRFQRVSYEPGKGEGELKALRRVNGQREPFAELVLKGDELTLVSPMGTRTFKRLEKVPEELEIKTLPLGKPMRLDAEKVKSIQKELARREEANLKVRFELRELKKPEERAAKTQELLKIDADDSKYVATLIEEVGWVDTRRFGPDAAHSAYLIVMHTHDFALMWTGIEQIEKDVRARDFDAEQWAGLFDRFRIVTGQRERYGHYVFANAKGELAIGPLEDRQRVDQWRKEIGLPTLAAYLARHKEANGGKDVQVVDDD